MSLSWWHACCSSSTGGLELQLCAGRMMIFARLHVLADRALSALARKHARQHMTQLAAWQARNNGMALLPPPPGPPTKFPVLAEHPDRALARQLVLQAHTATGSHNSYNTALTTALTVSCCVSVAASLTPDACLAARVGARCARLAVNGHDTVCHQRPESVGWAGVCCQHTTHYLAAVAFVNVCGLTGAQGCKEGSAQRLSVARHRGVAIV
jgi:hypothetical protein